MKANVIETVRKKNPVVLCLTNSVSENLCANALLALGASPIMSKSSRELEDLLQLAGALVINMGTLDDAFVDFSKQAIALANRHRIPVVFDPVGAGASGFRLQSAKALLACADSVIIKANASEVMALANIACNAKGVDSGDSTESALLGATALIDKTAASHVIISGPVDYVVSNEKTLQNTSGSPMMERTTGMGCALAACLAAAFAVEKDIGVASVEMLSFYTKTGERAAKVATGPGSFLSSFIDELAR